MSKQKKDSYFWTSFSDLMTSLFFVMLVLFVLTVSLLHNKMVDIDKERKATQEQLDKIKEIEESIRNINSEYFEYDSIYKRHTLKNISVSFKEYSFNINDINSDELNRLKEIGESIKSFVDSAVFKNPNVKYLLIIEGQSSKDNYYRNEYYNNDVLSYQRAFTLFKFWMDKEIIFNAEYCEPIISGSGQNSPFRILPDNRYNKANQRFVIHIIPKPGIIEKSKSSLQ
jgi:hypothetical protein